MDLLGSAGIQVHALKGAQSLSRRSGKPGKSEIELNHFIPTDLALIGDGCLRDQRLASGDGFRRQPQVTVAEAGVTQAISEGKERSAVEVAIGASLHRVVFKRRQLANSRIKSH